MRMGRTGKQTVEKGLLKCDGALCLQTRVSTKYSRTMLEVGRRRIRTYNQSDAGSNPEGILLES